ncbi:DUF427 domain-containing protein [Chitinophaga rhizophila]|uniref:DUF427 domain-containing protein n=1 Tax=Chitinophaga rhizophila TaxID=2866212 RepID=A0ABS7GID7_9BACT|nr:DUF427 domain-containing protein [Chitinophaga rhizophila]MBW8687457.1 DUF427 domain-containing protein [Chitinophaga rhizophila]
MKAIWQNEVIAESDKTVVVENNHYFPPTSVKLGLLNPSRTHTFCGWKGEASYYDVNIKGKINHDAAWYYPAPMQAAENIKGYIAFWKGVEVVD